MRTRILALLCAALILGSLFLPWFAVPFGEEFVPYDAISQLSGDQINQLLGDMPPEAMAFFASFVLAAVMLAMGLMGSTPKLLAFVTGALPVGLVVWAFISAGNQASAAGFDIPGGDLLEFLKQASEFIGIGAWAWIGSGATLLILGIFDAGPRRA